MPNANLVYRLRIRDASTVLNPNGTTDDLVVTSVRGGTNPYLAEECVGDGQEVDPLTGAVRTGAYNIQIIDAITSGTTRVLTSKLFDSIGRQKMLSRRAYVEISTNNGSSWTGLVAGYVLGYRLADALVWSVQIGDTRRIEQDKIVFDGTSANFARRGCLFGGPLVGGTWGPINDRGGWKFRVRQIVACNGGNHVIFYDFVNGYRGINDPLTTDLDVAIGRSSFDESNEISKKAQSYYSPSFPPYAWDGFPGITARIAELTGASNAGLFNPVSITTAMFPQIIASKSLYGGIAGGPATVFGVVWPAAITIPSVGDIHTIAIYTTKVSDVSPVYFTEHPVDVVTKLWNDAGIIYSASAAAAVRALLGDTLRVSMRITESMKMLDFLEKCIFGPFGIAARINGSGELELFTTRLKQNAAPSATINTDDLQGDDESIFGNDEDSIITAVRYKTRVYWAYNPNVADKNAINERPLDSVFESVEEVTVENTNLAAYKTKEISYDIPGMIHDVAGIAQNMDAFTKAIARETFDRYGTGAPMGEFAVLRQADPGTQIGEELYLQPGHLPNLNKRLLDDPSVGARIVQIVRRTETPAGPVFKYIDAGSNQQPVTPAATISIAKNSIQPQMLAEFTITNAAAINAALVLSVAVQWATGTSAPSDGVSFIRYLPTEVPTGAVQLPPVDPASKVWVRARTEQQDRRPSAWSAWTSVTLDPVATPSGLSVTEIYRLSAKYNWTNGTDALVTDIYVYPGTVAPVDWSTYFRCTVPTESTSVDVYDLKSVTDYVAGIQHRDPITGKVGPMITVAFTTTGIMRVGGIPMRGIAILPSVLGPDSSSAVGIGLALYGTQPAAKIEIWRAPDVAGVPGTYAQIASVSGTTTRYLDALAADGTEYWYFARQILGSIQGDGTASVKGVPGAIPISSDRPMQIANLDAIADFDISTDGTGNNDMAKAQAAGEQGAATGRCVNFGNAKIPVSHPGLIFENVGVIFDYVAHGNADGPGFYPTGGLITAGAFVAGHSYTIKTVGSTNFVAIGAASNTVGLTFEATGAGSGTGTCTYVAVEFRGVCSRMEFAIFGVGDPITPLRLNNTLLSRSNDIRVYNFAGGVKVGRMWDCDFSTISSELCGSPTEYAYSNVNDGDTCNNSAVHRLQVELADTLAIDISPDNISVHYGVIHSEQLRNADAAKLAYRFGGAHGTYDIVHVAPAASPGNVNIRLEMAGGVMTAPSFESGMNVEVEAYSGTSLVIISPAPGCTWSEKAGQSGKIHIYGGDALTWSGTQANVYWYTAREDLRVGLGTYLKRARTFPGFAITAESVSVANNGTVELGGDDQLCTLHLMNDQGEAAIFILQGGFHSTVLLVGDPTKFSIAAGTASSNNVYWNPGTSRYRLENKRGATIAYFPVRMGQVVTM